jgi:hypothetical protein
MLIFDFRMDIADFPGCKDIDGKKASGGGWQGTAHNLKEASDDACGRPLPKYILEQIFC